MSRQAVEGVAVGNCQVIPEQVTHGTVVEPMPMQSPFAAGVDQPVADQRLEQRVPLRLVPRSTLFYAFSAAYGDTFKIQGRNQLLDDGDLHGGWQIKGFDLCPAG